MQQATINLFSGFYLNFQMFRRLLKLYTGLLITLHFLIRPEDTTVISIKKPQQHQQQQQQQHKRDIIGGIKAIFWIGISIVLALLIGQLG